MFRSLSARRAWIEIDIPANLDADHAVALRKESVDRNNAVQIEIVKMYASLSARRAWIEIVKLFRQNYECFVALRKESVDRNLNRRFRAVQNTRRSPQGERG